MKNTISIKRKNSKTSLKFKEGLLDVVNLSIKSYFLLYLDLFNPATELT